MRGRSLLVFCLLSLCLGCVSRQPAMRFDSFRRLEKAPAVLEREYNEDGLANARVSFRAPGLRGAASGIVRVASGNKYLIEVYGRGELFLKIYFTDTQTILWPTAGAPQLFPRNNSPALNEVVNELLPAWKLDDLLPFPVPVQFPDSTIWAGGDNSHYIERINRVGFDVLYKEYEQPLNGETFPFRRVRLHNETGKSRLIWSLRQLSGQN